MRDTSRHEFIKGTMTYSPPFDHFNIQSLCLGINHTAFQCRAQFGGCDLDYPSSDFLSQYPFIFLCLILALQSYELDANCPLRSRGGGKGKGKGAAGSRHAAAVAASKVSSSDREMMTRVPSGKLPMYMATNLFPATLLAIFAQLLVQLQFAASATLNSAMSLFVFVHLLLPIDQVEFNVNSPARRGRRRRHR